ncbi:MAG: tetratricopeptide repeat protein [Leptolyngbyaceae cyanobacterium SL_1_1]|nr:tetratricopeptide repeat protein [Leptolyngbyaceae cyanobacterium RM1_1_2]NJO09208.1 tetratricopeptide repeat protein [Leptolyngbyaceae cyanobacterium SL_1_1]
MSIKRNRWLIVSVLVVAVAAFLALSLLPIFSATTGRRQSENSTAQSTDTLAAQQEELETRAKGYELVLQREPDNQTALRGLVEARIQLQDIEGVIEPLEKLAELNPDIPDYQVLLGQTKQRVGDLEGAAQSYRAVLTSAPGNMNALQGLVALLIQQERPQAAIGLLQDTLKTADQANQVQAGSIDTTSVQLLLGQIYAEESRFEDAIAIYDQAIKQDAQDFRPLLAKALVLQEQDKKDEAKPLFDNALALAPDQFKDQIQQLSQGQIPTPPGAGTPPAAPQPDESGAAPEKEAEVAQ